MAHWTRSLFDPLGLRVRRAGPDNRFDATADALRLLRARGFAPSLVIDGGANRGHWTDMAAPIFEGAAFHLIEPQPTRAGDLERFRPPRFHVHRVAVTRPGVTSVTMAGVSGDGRDTGAYVLEAGLASDGLTREVPATTFDAVLDGRVEAHDRVLLKLDLEGHELAALDGAARVLPRIELILTEVQFFEIGRNGLPVFSDVHDYLRARGFVLYDFAALAARPRDGRLRMGDVFFARKDSPLLADAAWE